MVLYAPLSYTRQNAQMENLRKQTGLLLKPAAFAESNLQSVSNEDTRSLHCVL